MTVRVDSVLLDYLERVRLRFRDKDRTKALERVLRDHRRTIGVL